MAEVSLEFGIPDLLIYINPTLCKGGTVKGNSFLLLTLQKLVIGTISEDFCHSESQLSVPHASTQVYHVRGCGEGERQILSRNTDLVVMTSYLCQTPAHGPSAIH